MHMNGPTKFFFDDPATDRLLMMVMALGAEVAALRDEVHTLRLLAAEKNLITTQEFMNYAPAPAAQAERDQMRTAMIANLLFPLEQECQRLTDAAPSKGDTK